MAGRSTIEGVEDYYPSSTYQDLPIPAQKGRACTSCTRNAIVVVGKAAFCAACWIDHLQTEGAADARP